MKKTDTDHHQKLVLLDRDLEYPLSAKVNAIPAALFDHEDQYALGLVHHGEKVLKR